MSDGSQGRFVYVIGGQTGAQKIGVADEPCQRLAAIQVYSPVKLAVHHQTDPSGNARLVELVAHRLQSEKRLHGEWFDVSIDEAVAAIKRAIELVDAVDLSGGRCAFNLTLPPEVIERVDTRTGLRSRSNMIELLVREGLERRGV